MEDLQIIRPKQAAKLMGISLSTLYRRCDDPEFPNKIQISKRAVGFRKQKLIEYLKGQFLEQEK